MDDSQSHPLADPIPDPAVRLQQFAISHAPHAPALPPHLCADLERYEITAVLHTVYEWGGYRYTNALDAIAAAKRGCK